MNSRRAATTFFVALCLVLCGLVLHRQIAAHHLPPEVSRQEYFIDQANWHPADAAITKEAKATVRGQLDAFHAGNAVKAMAYQSREMRIRFGDPVRFEQMIMTRYPAFGRYHSAQFGPIWCDPAGENTVALVIVEGEDGHRAQGKYQLIRENGQWHINHINIEWLPSEDRTNSERH